MLDLKELHHRMEVASTSGDAIWIAERMPFVLDLVEQMGEALAECQKLATDRIRTADAAVKRDVYAADALMGIAKTARDAHVAYQRAKGGSDA